MSARAAGGAIVINAEVSQGAARQILATRRSFAVNLPDCSVKSIGADAIILSPSTRANLPTSPPAFALCQACNMIRAANMRRLRHSNVAFIFTTAFLLFATASFSHDAVLRLPGAPRPVTVPVTIQGSAPPVD